MENTVRNGFLDDCPTYTVEHLVNNYFESPEWESFIADDGNFYVNVSGGFIYDNEPANALLQFYVEGDRFEVNAFEINRTPQSDFLVFSLIADMCDESLYFEE
ncbi:MAG: hypothetical protein O2818_04720 [Bacteroidetes bacterium]|nr:hypothetical protein [Bacteroidota bacterium]